jgi:hypothetical protein
MLDKIHVFHRTWWRPATPEDGQWPNNLVPCPGEKHTIDFVNTIEEAQRICHEYNTENNPGEMSDKAEFEDI